MAIIRCQACGKPNPDFLEKCQYCEAKLTPVSASAEDTLIRPPAATPEPPATPQDPLARLRAAQTFDAEPTEPTEPAEAPAEPGPADWMSRLRGVTAVSPGDETIVPGSHLAAAPEPDW